MSTKLMQFNSVVAGIVLLCAPSIQGGVSTYSNPANGTTTQSGGTPPPSGGSTAVTEWYGPFASWDNVKTKYGAKGDGAADDTAAINNALANVGLNGNSPVLYFPNGTYRVTQKLYLHNRAQIELLGQSRDGVVIKYDGATGSAYSDSSTVLHGDAINGCYFARITFDGNGKSKSIVSESQSSNPQYFDSRNVWEDCVFKNATSGGHGVDAGFYDQGFAGVNFTRCIFTNLDMGLVVWNWNALDGWATDSYFVNCNTAMDVKKGSLHAYNSKFVNNGTDFLLEPGAPFISLVSNVSYHAGVFFKSNNQGNNETTILLKGNTIIDPTGTTPIVLGQPGPVVLLDNTIANVNGAAVSCNNSLQADLLALGNTLVVANWLSIGGGSGLKTNLVDNTVVSRGSLSLSAPTSPIAAVNLNRTVVDMPTSFTSSSLQTAINNATDGSVIHLPWANNGGQQWVLTSTTTMPASKDLRVVGDGPATKLFWSGSSGSPMFTCPHPARATFSHLQLFGGSSGAASAGIEVTGVGSSAARVYLRDAIMMRGMKANVRLGDCLNTVIDWCSRGGEGGDQPPANGANIVLEGRGKVKYIDTEGGGAPDYGYICTNGGSLYVETCYNEGGDTHNEKHLKVSGTSKVTFLSGKFVANFGNEGLGYSRSTGNGFAAIDFSGQFLMGLINPVNDWNSLSGATTGDIWICGNITARSPQTSTWPVNNSTGDTAVQSMNWNGADAGNTRYQNVGTASAAYTRQMFSQARAEYSDRSAMSRRDGQTDVLIEHVVFELGQQNLWVKP